MLFHLYYSHKFFVYAIKLGNFEKLFEEACEVDRVDVVALEDEELDGEQDGGAEVEELVAEDK